MSTRSARAPSDSVLGVSSLVQLEREASSDGRLSQMVYDYYASGSDCQETLADNRASFARYKLLPRMLRDVSSVDMSTSVVGALPRRFWRVSDHSSLGSRFAQALCISTLHSCAHHLHHGSL